MNGSLAPLDSAYFQRQMRLPGVGVTGQQRLRDAHVLVVGLGALGCPAVTYLARAGVGRMTLYDGDTVEYHNLHRQTLYGPNDVGRSKAETAGERLRHDYPGMTVDCREAYFDGIPSNISPADIILDCTDRFSSRYCVHDAAHRGGIDLVSAAVTAFTGQIQLFRFSRERVPCLRCLYPTAPPDGCTGSCGDDGIIGAAAGTMGALQALYALRILLGMTTPASAATHTFELATMEVMTTSWDADPECPLCGSGGEQTRQNDTVAVESDPAYGDVHGVVSHDGSRPGGASPTVTDTASSPSTPQPLHPQTRVIDLREREEIIDTDRRILPQAESIPMEQFLDIFRSLKRDEEYLLICEHGQRSEMVREVMRAAGFTAVSDVEGGYAALRDRLR